MQLTILVRYGLQAMPTIDIARKGAQVHIMKKYFHFRLFVSLCLLLNLMLFCGCNDEKRKIKAYKATATASILDFPQSYYEMEKSTQHKLSVKVRVKNINSVYDDEDVTLDYHNDYQASMYLMPGEYEVTSVYLSEAVLFPFRCSEELEGQTFTVKAFQDTPLTITLEDCPVYEPQVQIMNADPFEHIIQIRDQVYHFDDLINALSFYEDTQSSNNQGEYKKYVSNEISGLQLYMIADKIAMIYIENRDVLLWHGMHVGEDISKYANPKNGYIGSPSYADGSPLVGMDIDNARLTFFNSNNSERIVTNIPAGCTYVSSITYYPA